MVIVAKLNDDLTQATSRPYLENDWRSFAPPAYNAITSFGPVNRNGGSTVQTTQVTTRPMLIQDYYDDLSAARVAAPTARSPSFSFAALPSSLQLTRPTILRVTSVRKMRRLAFLAFIVLLSTVILLALARQQGWSEQIWRIAHGVPKPLATKPQQTDGRVVKQFSTTGSNWTQMPPKRIPDGWAYSFRLELDLPLHDLHGYYFVLRGGSTGDIQVNEGAPGDKVHIDITAQYREWERVVWNYEYAPLFKMASAYLLERRTTETGVGLYLPIVERQPDLLVTITIPRSLERLTRLQSLQIDAVQLNARFTLEDGVAIDDLTVAANKIHSKAAFETSTSNLLSSWEITGQLSACKQLRLEASSPMGALRASSFLGHGAPVGFTPSIELKSQGTIGGSVALLDANHFRVRLGDQDYSGAENIYYAVESLPVNAFLDLEAYTSYGDIEVRVPPTYQGSLDLCKAEHDADPVRVAQGLRDPTGGGAEHVLSTSWSNDRRWRGNVGWGSNDTRGGSVRLLSETHGHCRLSIS